MRKVLAVVAVVCVVFVAGAALAQPEPQGRGDQRRLPPQHQEQRMERGRGEMPPAPFEGCRGRHCGGRRGMMFAPDMPEDVKAKAVEAAKLRIDLEAALSSRPVDKAKALEIFGQLKKAEQEVELWMFGKKIDRIEAFRKQQELNRNVPPAPPAPASEAPAE